MFGPLDLAVILLGFLLSATTEMAFSEKQARYVRSTMDIEVMTIIANGGLRVLAIFAFITEEWETGLWMFSAAVAVATSYLASEIGCLDDNVRMITTFKRCEAGINGGFSPSGQLAALAGSRTHWCGFPSLVLHHRNDGLQIGLTLSAAVVVIGWLGCQMDSLLEHCWKRLPRKGGVNGIPLPLDSC